MTSAVASTLGAGCRALIFDFNGTLSDDESLLYEIYAAMFAQRGRPLSRRAYVDSLAGRSDEAILRAWLGERDDIDALVQERIARYRALADGATIRLEVRRAVRYAARRVATAIVSGAATVEIDGVLAGAALGDAFSVIIGSDQVSHGKPDPEGYELALARLGAGLDGLRAADVVAFEDTAAGIAAAKAAGMVCFAVTGTVPRARLSDADAIVETIDVAALARLLG